MRMNAKKKEKTRRETTAIKVWVTPAEKAAITVKAGAYSLSASTYLRELALRSTRPPTRPGEKINHRGKRTDLQRVRLKRAKHAVLPRDNRPRPHAWKPGQPSPSSIISSRSVIRHRKNWTNSRPSITSEKRKSVSLPFVESLTCVMPRKPA